MYQYILSCEYWSPEDLEIGATDRRDLIKSKETNDINELIEIINVHGLTIDGSIVDDTMINLYSEEPYIDLKTGIREYYSLHVMSEANQIQALLNTIKGELK